MHAKTHVRKILCGLAAVSFWLGLSLSVRALPTNQIQSVGLKDYVEVSYDEGDGMIAGEANTVLQDEKGYIWIGSYGGLGRYNGNEFENLSLQGNGAPTSGIRALFLDSSNRIWIGTNDSGLYLFENGAFRRITEPGDDSGIDVTALSVRSITEDSQGQIYAGTTNGLFIIDEEYRILHIADSRLSESTIPNLICDTNGCIWGVTSDSQVFAQKGEDTLLVLEEEFFGTSLSSGLFQSAAGSIYVGTKDNLVLRLKQTGTDYNAQSLRIEELSTGSRAVINDIYADTRGKLWICSDNGLGYFGDSDIFYEVHGLSQDSIIEKMCEDYEGNLWFASSRIGFLGLIRGKFNNIGYEAGISGQAVNAALLYDDHIYIGTDDGLSVVDSEGNLTPTPLSDFLKGIRIRSLMVDSADRLWISTYQEYGLVCYDKKDGSWQSYTAEDGLAHTQVRMALELSNGDIAAATNGGVSILHEGQVTASYTAEEGIQNEVILCLAETEDGTLLAGSDGNGIYALNRETGEIRNYTTEDGLASGVILRMAADPAAGGIWISNGVGLSLWKEGEISPVPDVPAGVGSIFDILVRGDDIWLVKTFGMIRIDRQDLLSGNPVYDSLTRKDGLTGSVTANSWNYLGDDGQVYLCTGNGVYSINLQEMYRNESIPKIAVAYITADDETFYPDTELTLPADTRRITFYLELLSYGFTSGSLEYYLEGFDEAPILVDSSTENRVTYTNLSGGSYVFHLRGYNSDGGVSEELLLHITKKRSFFERTSSYVYLGLGVLLLVLLVVALAQYLHKRAILKRQEEYRELTAETIKIVAKTIDAKDKYTIGHSNRVANCSLEIGKRFGLPKNQLEQLYYCALLHDIGKIAIPDSILNKEGRLTDEEYELVKQHPSIGGEILKDFAKAPWISDGARYHHERYDGTGYNEGLAGEEIPLYARIISVADTFDCMYFGRHYRPAAGKEEICRELKAGSGTQFDPVFVKIMVEMLENGYEVPTEKMDLTEWERLLEKERSK